MTKRFLVLAYGVGAYLLFLVSFCYAIAFVGGFVVPRTVDHGIGDGRPLPAAIAISTSRWRDVNAAIRSRAPDDRSAPAASGLSTAICEPRK